eukprot:857418-Pleurochrysis_carterae.AAC.1
MAATKSPVFATRLCALAHAHSRKRTRASARARARARAPALPPVKTLLVFRSFSPFDASLLPS